MSPSREGPSLSRPSARRALGWLLLLSFLVYAVPFWWGLPSDKGWSFDEIRPSQVVDPLRWPAKYPPLHHHLLWALFAPVRLVASALDLELESPQLYAVLYLLSRFLSVLLATATIYLIYRSGRLLFDRTTSLLAAASAAFVIPFVYYAKTVNLEAPYLFWFALSLFFYLRALQRHRLRDYLLFSSAAIFSICTKDQAYGLYLLIPLVLAVDLARQKRHQKGAAAVVSALVDRRLLAGLAVGFVWFTLIYGGGLWGEEFWEHLRKVTSRRMVGQYRLYSSTLGGQLEMTAQSFRHLWYALSPPLLIASLIGLATTLRRPLSSGRLLSLLVIPFSYYAFFIAVIGYNYVRFFLPICLVLSFFAARGLAEVLHTQRLRPALRRVLVAVALAYPLTWSVAIDLLMLGDARYGTEEWLRTEQAGARTIGIGRQKMLPRGIERVDWVRLHKDQCARLRSLDADLLVVNPQDPKPGQEARALRRLGRGVYGYQEKRTIENRFPIGFFADKEVLWNLDKLGQDIVIFARSDDECFDSREISRKIDELKSGSRAIDRQRLAQVILEEGVVGTIPIGSDAVQAVGLASDNWTRGTRPAAVVVRGGVGERLRHRIRVAFPDGTAEFPVTVFVQDELAVVEHVLQQPGQLVIELPEVAPEANGLFVIWTDSAWSPGRRDRRLLGVRLLPVRKAT